MTAVGGLENTTGCCGSSAEVSSARTFGHVLGIVQPDAKDVLAGPRDRGQQAHIVFMHGDARRACTVGFRQCAGDRGGGVRPQIDQVEHRRGQRLAHRLAQQFHIHNQAIMHDAKASFLIRAVAVRYEFHVFFLLFPAASLREGGGCSVYASTIW